MRKLLGPALAAIMVLAAHALVDCKQPAAPGVPGDGGRPVETQCPPDMRPDATGRCRRDCPPGVSCGGGTVQPPNCGDQNCTTSQQCYTTASGKRCDAPGKAVCGDRLCNQGERCIGGQAGGRLPPTCVAVSNRLCGQTVCSSSQVCMSPEVGAGKKCMPPGSTPCGLTICTPQQACVHGGPGEIRLGHCVG